jgi:cation diffusion facilitator CzcD-associated flavoprotein CzcO
MNTSAGTQAAGTESVKVAIIGTGFAGLGLATLVKRSGEESFLVLERSASVGGTWRDNTYPGAACDVPSHLYSFSFRLNPAWSRVYAPQPEILSYLQRTADEEGLMPHMRFGTEVLEARWSETARYWVIATTTGTYRAQVMVSATGHLCDPKLPDIAGLDSFAGPVFHSARWDHDAKLAGARVGIIGTGASSVQITPHVAALAGELTVFQRSAPYIVPRPDREYTAAEQGMFARMPELIEQLRDDLFWAAEARFPQRRQVTAFLDQIRGLAQEHREAQIADPELRAKVTPDYTIGCKRIIVSNDYYPALTRPTVTVETTPISRIAADAVVLKDGSLRELDVLILATGFEAIDLPIAHLVHGRDGRLLADQWEDEGEQAFACVAVHGFPNYFIMNGPNTGLGAGSIVYMVETQMTYILSALAYLREHGVAVLEPDAEAEDLFAADLVRRSQGTVWLDGGCRSWYVDERTQRLTAIWPDFMSRYRAENGQFSPEGYRLLPA